MKVYLEKILPDECIIKPGIKLPMEVESPNSVPCTITVLRQYPIGGAPFNYFCLSSNEFGFLPEMPMGSIDAMIEYTKDISPSVIKMETKYKNIYDACLSEAAKKAKSIGLITNEAFCHALDVGHTISDIVNDFREAIYNTDYLPIVDICKNAKEAKDIISAVDKKKKEYGEIINDFCDAINTSFEGLQKEMLKAFETRLKHPDRFVHLMTFSMEGYHGNT